MSHKLTYEECIKIQVYLEEELSHREIGKKIGRSNSSISDEIRKHSVNGKYIASMAWIIRKTRRELVNALHCKIQR
jgi:IS30 family transposase